MNRPEKIVVSEDEENYDEESILMQKFCGPEDIAEKISKF